MPVYDFSGGFANLNAGVNSLADAIQERQAGELWAKAIGGNPLAQQPQGLANLPVQTQQPTQPLRTNQSLANLAPIFQQVEAQYGLPGGYLSKTASVESRGNPNAQNPKSSAGGMFQFIDSTAKQYGLNDKFDPVASTGAAGQLAGDNKKILTSALGRDPTAGELYLAHQQGAGGAAKLLANPAARAVDVLGSKAVMLNGGDPNMTAGQFAQKWTQKIDQGAATAPAGNVVAQAPTGGIDKAMLAELVRNPKTRAAGLALWQAQQQGGYSLTTVGDQAVRFNSKTGSADLIPGLSKPNVEIKELNGKLLLVDKQKGVASDITPGGVGGGYRPMTADERKAFGIPNEQGAAIGPDSKPIAIGTQHKTTVSTAANPILKGLGDRFNEDMDTARAAVDQVQSIYEARQALDQGAITGAFADKRLFFNKVASLFDIAGDKAANTETFRAAIGDSVLARAKQLGANPSNTDRDYIEKVAGGKIELEEKAIRRLLDIQEKWARIKIGKTNEHGKRLLAAQPDELKSASPLMSVDVPGSYEDFVKSNPPAKAPIKVNSPAEARKLPKGTPIILPDGSEGRVP